MGHNPVPPPPRPRRQTRDEITERRLELLTDLYVDGELDLPSLERHVTSSLQGQQPVGADGLPFMADPSLNGR
jgi:hypothetical protein